MYLERPKVPWCMYYRHVLHLTTNSSQLAWMSSTQVHTGYLTFSTVPMFDLAPHAYYEGDAGGHECHESYNLCCAPGVHVESSTVTTSG
jgi:hypothetical protein